MADKLLNDYKTYPPMARWFSPGLLFALLQNVVLSSVFGRYADRRLMIAALDTVPVDKHLERATRLKPEPIDGAVWLDFVADLGDGFDSTYAMATLLARKDLKVGMEILPRGQMLIMGGDEVYPKASEQAYSNQLRQPYRWAFPDHDRHADHGVPVFAIPGNHDWYDGLDLFLAYFCREKHWHLGSWRSQQRRSYFALQLTDVWWLWATDIQLAETMDQPQAEYFAAIAAHMPSKAKIILCSAEPGWLYTDTNIKSWDIMDFALGIASAAKNADGSSKELKVPILLSGDTHHYSRYETKDGVQFVTSGGGGAFLHPTHHLEQNITVEWLGVKRGLQLGNIPNEMPDSAPSPACYPSKETCQTLTWQNLFFALTNGDFALLMGAIYWLGGIAIAIRDQWDVYLAIAAVFGWGIIGYTKNQEKPKGWKKALPVYVSSAVHAGCHVAAVILFARYFASWNEAHPLLPGHWYSGWVWLLGLLVQMGLVGFFVGGTLFGVNLAITCRWLRMNRNDAFSALRLGRYNNFLRLRIKDETVEIFAIGLDDVPERDDWFANPAAPPMKAGKRDPDQPIFIPKQPLKPHLIEHVTVTA